MLSGVWLIVIQSVCLVVHVHMSQELPINLILRVDDTVEMIVCYEELTCYFCPSLYITV